MIVCAPVCSMASSKCSRFDLNAAEPCAVTSEFFVAGTANAALLRQVNEAARTDPLTGLLNRRALEQRLEFEYKRASRDKSPLALVMLDIDFFKK